MRPLSFITEACCRLHPRLSSVLLAPLGSSLRFQSNSNEDGLMPEDLSSSSDSRGTSNIHPSLSLSLSHPAGRREKIKYHIHPQSLLD